MSAHSIENFPPLFGKLNENPIMSEFILLVADNYECITDFDQMNSDLQFINFCEIPKGLLERNSLNFISRKDH